MPRIMILSLTLVLAACGGGPAGGGKGGLPPAKTPVVAVGTVEVVDTVQRTGRIEASALVEIRPRVSGAVETSLVADGAEVSAGQVLLTIDARPYRAALDRAAAQVTQVDALLDQTRRELARSERLRAADPRAIGDEDLERRRQLVNAAAAQRAAAAATLVNAELDLEWTKVTAPFAGRLGRIAVDPGALVDRGTPIIAVLTQADPSEVVLALDEAEAARLDLLCRSASTAVTFGLAAESGFPRSATVTFIDARADVLGASVQVRARVANPDGALRPGVAVRALIPQSHPRSVPAVAETAIMAEQTNRSVLKVGPDNIPRSTPVVLGRRLANRQREILSGISAGDEVILHPAIPRVFAGVAIEPVRESASTAAAVEQKP